MGKYFTENVTAAFWSFQSSFADLAVRRGNRLVEKSQKEGPTGTSLTSINQSVSICKALNPNQSRLEALCTIERKLTKTLQSNRGATAAMKKTLGQTSEGGHLL